MDKRRFCQPWLLTGKYQQWYDHCGIHIHHQNDIILIPIKCRDAIQFVHDQTVRWMNKVNPVALRLQFFALFIFYKLSLQGFSVREIAEKVTLPPNLENHPFKISCWFYLDFFLFFRYPKKFQVTLPPHLANHPYLTEYYGTVEWSVKAVYHGYLGWFR